MRREDFFEMRLPVPNQVDAVLEEQYGPRFLTTVLDVSRWTKMFLQHTHIYFPLFPLNID